MPPECRRKNLNHTNRGVTELILEIVKWLRDVLEARKGINEENLGLAQKNMMVLGDIENHLDSFTTNEVINFTRLTAEL